MPREGGRLARRHRGSASGVCIQRTYVFGPCGGHSLNPRRPAFGVHFPPRCPKVHPFLGSKHMCALSRQPHSPRTQMAGDDSPGPFPCHRHLWEDSVLSTSQGLQGGDPKLTGQVSEGVPLRPPASPSSQEVLLPAWEQGRQSSAQPKGRGDRRVQNVTVARVRPHAHALRGSPRPPVHRPCLGLTAGH